MHVHTGLVKARFTSAIPIIHTRFSLPSSLPVGDLALVAFLSVQLAPRRQLSTTSEQPGRHQVSPRSEERANKD